MSDYEFHKGLLKREVMKSELKDLETVIKKIDECMEYIDSLTLSKALEDRKEIA